MPETLNVGPRPGQSFVGSIGIPFGLTVQGTGLGADNRMRVASLQAENSSCSNVTTHDASVSAAPNGGPLLESPSGELVSVYKGGAAAYEHYPFTRSDAQA